MSTFLVISVSMNQMQTRVNRFVRFSCERSKKRQCNYSNFSKGKLQIKCLQEKNNWSEHAWNDWNDEQLILEDLLKGRIRKPACLERFEILTEVLQLEIMTKYVALSKFSFISFKKVF